GCSQPQESEKPAEGRAYFAWFGPSELDRPDLDGLWPLVARLGLVRNLHSLVERAEALLLDSRMVHEQVRAALVWGDEAEALVRVEPLYGSRWHVVLHGLC